MNTALQNYFSHLSAKGQIVGRLQAGQLTSLLYKMTKVFIPALF